MEKMKFLSKPLPALCAASVLILVGAGTVAAKNWDSWSAPLNLESLSGSSTALNTATIDGCAAHSRDGLTLVFNSNRDGSHDIYMATRASTSEGFGAPVKLPAPINTDTYIEACPTFGPGNRLYYHSSRDDPPGDIMMSKRGPKGWSTPVNLGPNINTPGMVDEAPDFYTDDEGREVMIFTSRNPAGTTGAIYMSVEGAPATPVPGGVHSSAADARASVTNDGLTIFWDSTRSGSLGAQDLYYATRTKTSDPFGTAIHLSALSSSVFDARPFISKDGTFMTFSSARPGGDGMPDMWITSRVKITGR